MRVVVLASGRGSNLEALIAAQRSGELPIRIVGVVSDKRKARALQLARDNKIDAIHLDPKGFTDRASYDLSLFANVAELKPDLIVLAGFMRILDPVAFAPWLGRIINIHPSLLPLYPGLHTHRRALEAGDSKHGASVHFVTAELDGGPVIAQTRIDVAGNDTEETLAARMLTREHALLKSCIELLANGRVSWSDGKVFFDGEPLAAPVHFECEMHASG
ncbi:MAG: phosphoribosylglycinamide formyltransferase [Dokdonella sp.]